VLVFSQFTSFLTMVKAVIEKRIGKEKMLYLDGTTPIRKREKMVADFQHGVAPVFLISLKAGGLGLNLTNANYVIHLDPWWNPAIEQQATDRAYRIGQDKNVTVYHLIAENTIEEKILRLHKTKRDLADSLLSDSNVSRAMTIDDLRYLVKQGGE
jgi:SNF2 family DNA or RNA helicase